jgi:hypothetical protein
LFVFTLQTNEWYVHNRLFNANFEGKFKLTPDTIIFFELFQGNAVQIKIQIKQVLLFLVYFFQNFQLKFLFVEFFSEIMLVIWELQKKSTQICKLLQERSKAESTISFEEDIFKSNNGSLLRFAPKKIGRKIWHVLQLNSLLCNNGYHNVSTYRVTFNDWNYFCSVGNTFTISCWYTWLSNSNMTVQKSK